ncbi:hypothetical protein F5880DRAFT_1493389 [Lentinula raphanica]|nr:hypothetical protein F5880DRAFT_1493389 [Lentinula raphanica]
MKRDPSGASVTPEQLYLKPVNVVHPFYYPTFKKCPRCDSENIKWEGWTGSGSREIHGIACEETAIGMQLRCSNCKNKEGENGKPQGYCFGSTSNIFWDRLEHWEIPRGIPHFRHQIGLTPELFNLIIETRISGTSAGLAEHIRRCVLSLDATFRAAKKATISDSNKQRTSVVTGGVLSIINELSETLAWVSPKGCVNHIVLTRFCHTQSPEEIAELLTPLRERYRELGAPPPEMIVVDNCCAVRTKILSVFPQTHVVLDVWHFLKRYLSAVNRGAKNPCYKSVAYDITSAVLEKSALKSPTGIAVYHPQQTQIIKLEAAYQKWAKMNIWNASGAGVCLTSLSSSLTPFIDA